MVTKTPFIVGGIIILLVLVVMFTPVGQQITIGQQFEQIGQSCSTDSNCETFLRNQGASNEDIANTNFRCRNTQCEVEKIKPFKDTPNK